MIVNCISSRPLFSGSFCDLRPNGNWANPWDSHSYITCNNNTHVVFTCYDSMVYDPDKDRCIREGALENYSETISANNTTQFGMYSLIL